MARRSAFHRITDQQLRLGRGDAELFSRIPRPNANDQFAVPVAKRRALQMRDLSGGVYTSQDLIWLIPQAVLPAQTICKVSDIVTDGDGRNWTVQEAQHGKWRQTWRLVCRDLVLAFSLYDTIDVQRPGISYDAAGVAVKTWPPNPAGATIYSRLPCQVQETGQEIVEERGIRGTKIKFDVIMSRQVDLTSDDRIVWAGRILEIRGMENEDQINVLPVVKAELMP